ncbi:Hypothetical protein PBC10988_36510 [Planctomycetales bacterium 10988]|nr:Hypothetical protein PBC10988_36510 [Planctomycetales bacterium 10988]
MRVILQVIQGNQTGKKAWLGSGQMIEVGRSEWVDFSIADDPHLAEVHFSLHCDGFQCHMQDLSGGLGVVINGEPHEARHLDHGDNIGAGQTLFAVVIEGAQPRPEQAESDQKAPQVAEKPADTTAEGAIDPGLVEAEQAYRESMVLMEEQGGPKSHMVEIRFGYMMMLKGLADILDQQNRKEEAAPLRELATELEEEDQMQRYLGKTPPDQEELDL